MRVEYGLRGRNRGRFGRLGLRLTVPNGPFARSAGPGVPQQHQQEYTLLVCVFGLFVCLIFFRAAFANHRKPKQRILVSVARLALVYVLVHRAAKGRAE